MPNYISKEGLEKLKNDLIERKTLKRQDIAERLEHAKALGDLSENAEYAEVKSEQELLEAEIVELEERIRDAVIIEKNNHTDKVSIGSTITVTSSHGEETYTIVGPEEANPLKGKISNESPMGKAFLGHRLGETVDVQAPGGVKKYEVMGIQ